MVLVNGLPSCDLSPIIVKRIIAKALIERCSDASGAHGQAENQFVSKQGLALCHESSLHPDATGMCGELVVLDTTTPGYAETMFGSLAKHRLCRFAIRGIPGSWLSAGGARAMER